MNNSPAVSWSMMKTLPCDDWLTLDDDATLLLLFKRALLANRSADSPQLLVHIHAAAQRANALAPPLGLMQWLIVSAPRLPSLAVFDLLLADSAPVRVGPQEQNAFTTLLAKKLTRDDERQTRIRLLARWARHCAWIADEWSSLATLPDVDRDDPTLVAFIRQPPPDWARVELPPLRDTVVPFILAPRPDAASLGAEWAPFVAATANRIITVSGPGLPDTDNPPLHCALERNAPLDVIAVLLAHGANVNQQRNIDGSPPLHLSPSFECDQLLISAGANPRLLRSSDGRALSQARPHDFDFARTWFLTKEAPRLNKAVMHATLLHICIAMAPIFADLAAEVVDRIVMMLPGMRVVDASARLALIVRIGTAYGNKCDGGSVGLLPLESRERAPALEASADDEVLPHDELERRVRALLPDLSSSVLAVAMPAAVAVRRLVTVPEHASVVVKCGVLPLLIDLVKLDSHQLTFEVLWSLTNISMENVPDLLALNVVPLVSKLTLSTDANVSLQALWTLCNIGHDSNDGRRALVNAGVHAALRTLILERTDVSLPILQHASELCFAVCGGKSIERLELMLPLLLALVRSSEDSKVLADACKGLTLLGGSQPSRLLDIGVVPRLIDLLSHASHDVRMEALVTIGTLASGNEVETGTVATPVVCARLLELFQSPVVNVVKEAAFVASNLCAGTDEQKRLVVECGIVGGLIPLVRFADEQVQREAAWSLANLSSTADTGIITNLVDNGVTTVMLRFALCLPEDSESAIVVIEFLDRIKNDARFLKILRGVDGALDWLCRYADEYLIAKRLVEFEAEKNTQRRKMSDEISIQVKVLSGASHSLRVPRDALVASVQARLVDVANMPVPRQRLIFRGRVLLPDQTIESYGVSDGAVLHLVTRADPSATSATSAAAAAAAAPADAAPSATFGNASVRVFNLGQLADGVSLANSVMSALGLSASTAPAAAATSSPPAQSLPSLLDLLDDNSAADVLADATAMDSVGRATCERAAANLERLAAQLRRGELCELRLQRNGEVLRRLATALQQATPAAEGAPLRAPSGVQGSANLQDIVSATVARIGATDFNLQSLSQSLGPLLNQLSNAAAPVIASATSAAQLAMNGSNNNGGVDRAATPATSTPVVPAAAAAAAVPAAAAATDDNDDHVDTLRALLKTVFGTLGVTALLQIQGGDWSPMQAAHPNLRAALLEQLSVANASDVTPAMVSEFARQCAAAVRHVAMRSDEVPPELAARIARGSDPFGAIERETATHIDMFVNLLLKDWTPTPSQATPFGDATARWSNMFVSALVGAVRPTVVGGNDDIAAVLRHVCSKTLMASIPAPTATMLTNIVMSHVSRTHLKIEAKAVPVATAAAPAASAAAAATTASSAVARARPISTAGLEVFPAEWRETIARDLQTPVPPQGALSELYSRGQSQKQRAFDARLAAALSAAGVEGARAQRVLADVPQALKDEF